MIGGLRKLPQEFAHISSSAVRDILRHGGDYSAFIPEGIEL